MTPTKIDALPPHIRAQVQAQLDADEARRTVQPTPAAIALPMPLTCGTGRKPNKTERAYRRAHLDTRPDVRAVWYEGLTFRMGNGHKYTPDWVVARRDGRMECHEVKGAYRLHSHQRARLAFDQARVEWPEFVWVWGHNVDVTAGAVPRRDVGTSLLLGGSDIGGKP